MSDPKISLIIEAVNNFSGPMSDFVKAVSALNNTVESLKQACTGISTTIKDQVDKSKNALDELLRTGETVSDRLGNHFKKLNLRSAFDIEAEKQRLTASFEAIKTSGVASASEISRAKEALSQKLAKLDSEAESGLHRQKVSTDGFCNSLGYSLLLMTQIAAVGRTIGNMISPAVTASIDYNKQMEISRLGISAILTSMTDIKDAQGNVLTGAAKWQESTRYTAQTQGDLMKIAMTTAVTYQELVAAYQGILAPALSAKMNFKDKG